MSRYDKVLSEPIKEPEPVGYISPNGMLNIKHPCTNYDLIYREPDNNFTPVYTTPPDAAKRIAELEDNLEHEKLCINGYLHAIDVLKEKINVLETRINNGIRVYAHRDNIDGFTAATNRDISYSGKMKANATLILDEEDK